MARSGVGTKFPIKRRAAVGASGPALALGSIEVLEAPLELARALASLRPHLVDRRRVLVVGGDGPGLLALRQCLTRAGASVSIGWDVKQATDLLEVVRPEMVIVDLALRGRTGSSPR